MWTAFWLRQHANVRRPRQQLQRRLHHLVRHLLRTWTLVYAPYRATNFTTVNFTVGAFNPTAPVGAPFRSAPGRLSAASCKMDLLKHTPSIDEIEDQVQRARGGSSPGLNGIGYDIYKMFAAQILPAFHMQHSRAAGSTSACRRAGRSSWCACCTRKLIGLTHRIGDRSARSSPSTNYMLVYYRADLRAGWMLMGAMQKRERFLGDERLRGA